jgi:hypothetical protein
MRAAPNTLPFPIPVVIPEIRQLMNVLLALRGFSIAMALSTIIR